MTYTLAQTPDGVALLADWMAPEGYTPTLRQIDFEPFEGNKVIAAYEALRRRNEHLGLRI